MFLIQSLIFINTFIFNYKFYKSIVTVLVEGSINLTFDCSFKSQRISLENFLLYSWAIVNAYCIELALINLNIEGHLSLSYLKAAWYKFDSIIFIII